MAVLQYDYADREILTNMVFELGSTLHYGREDTQFLYVLIEQDNYKILLAIHA